MSIERKKVLEMLADKKITAEEAERLLDKLENSAPTDGGDKSSREKAGTTSAAAEPKKARHMRILVERPGREDVNIRIPMEFARTGTRLAAVLPPEVIARLREQGIDMSFLSSLKAEEMAGVMDNFQMDIDKGNGRKVKIFCE